MLELEATSIFLPVTLELVIAAVRIRRRFKVSHWDATIIAVAQELGYSTLFSEEFNHGQNFDGGRELDFFDSKLSTTPIAQYLIIICPDLSSTEMQIDMRRIDR